MKKLVYPVLLLWILATLPLPAAIIVVGGNSVSAKPIAAAGGGGGITLHTIDGKAATTGTTTVHVLTSQPANSYYTIFASNEGDAGTPDFTITDNLGTPLTYTLRASSPATVQTGNINVWTTSVFSAGGSITITITCTTGNKHRNSCVFGHTGNETSFTTTVPTPVTLQTTANISVTTPVANCYVLLGTSDWSATSGTITYRNGESAGYDPGATANFRGYYYYKSVSSASTASYGTTAPTTGANQTTCAIIVRPP